MWLRLEREVLLTNIVAFTKTILSFIGLGTEFLAF